MKNYTLLKNTMLCVCVLLVSVTAAAFPSDSAARVEIANAIHLARGSQGRIDRQKAFETLKHYAEAGTPRAMNALGLMYIEGREIKSDSTLGLYWLEKAANAGYVPAWCNLGTVYKYAHAGVVQNLEKAYDYYEKAAQKGYPDGYYGAGYMLYKGLGCGQDYEKAFGYFQEGAAKEYAPAMYMLGLCYRNGYGVKQSPGNANFWLAAADKKAYKFATDELESEAPENSYLRTTLRSVQQIEVPAQFARVNHLRADNVIDGTYDGVLVTYDWSGKHIISEKTLRLHLVSDGETVNGEWIEAETDTVLLQAVNHSGGLSFTGTRQYRADHYTTEHPLLYQFEKAEIQLINDSYGISLNGNIRMFSQESMEPERPMYISLRKAEASSSIEAETTVKGMKAYPVPFSGELNISFVQEEQAAVNVGIYNYSGTCVYLYDAGRLPAGEQRLTLTPVLPDGTYIVKLMSGNKSAQVIVMAKGGKL